MRKELLCALLTGCVCFAACRHQCGCCCVTDHKCGYTCVLMCLHLIDRPRSAAILSSTTTHDYHNHNANDYHNHMQNRPSHMQTTRMHKAIANTEQSTTSACCTSSTRNKTQQRTSDTSHAAAQCGVQFGWHRGQGVQGRYRTDDGITKPSSVRS